MTTKNMKTYRVRVTAEGYATVSAATKREARERMERGEYDRAPVARWWPQVSTIEEVPARSPAQD